MPLTLKNVSKSFLSHTVLRDINLRVSNGEFVCIIGFSGCGKTTLLRVIGGFETYTGEVIHEDQLVDSPSPGRFMVFQTLEQLLPWKTVFENVAFGLKLTGEKSFSKVHETLELVGLTDAKNKYPHQLSGGMKQRAAIARALVMSPSVLLMDEPFGSLDAQTRRRLEGELVDIWQAVKTTIIFVTHNIRESILLADRIIVMSRYGEIKSEITIDLPRPRNPAMDGFSNYWAHTLSEMEVMNIE
jgi:NitT/TauT family transport system ATP-binding protein